MYSQKPRHKDQLAMDVGDLVGIAGNEKDGTSKGKHRKTNKYGEYYSYLVEEVPIVTDFPTYPGIWTEHGQVQCALMHDLSKVHFVL